MTCILVHFNLFALKKKMEIKKYLKSILHRSIISSVVLNFPSHWLCQLTASLDPLDYV